MVERISERFRCSIYQLLTKGVGNRNKSNPTVSIWDKKYREAQKKDTARCSLILP